MKKIIQELKRLLKNNDIGTDSDRALLLDFQATLEPKPEKAIKLEKDALSIIKEVTADPTFMPISEDFTARMVILILQ